jgi:GT2 family glycosyltransferase
MAPLPAVQEPTLSVLILTFNDQEILNKCLVSLYKNNYSIDFETIVINNGSSILSGDFKNRFPDIRWIENNKNLGFARAINQGIKAARARYILVLNSDTILLPESFLPLIKFMDEHKQTGAAGGKILNPEGIVQPSCRRFPNYLTGLFNRTSWFTRLLPNNPFSKRYLLNHWDHENIRRVDWVCGAYILFRKEALIHVGYLDENYFMYCEEADWCYRAKKKGWKTYYVPQARLIHSHRCNEPTPRKIISHHKSMYRFYCKRFRPPLIFQILIVSGIFFRVGVLFLLYSLGIAFNNLARTKNVSNKLSNSKAWHR